MTDGNSEELNNMSQNELFSMWDIKLTGIELERELESRKAESFRRWNELQKKKERKTSVLMGLLFSPIFLLLLILIFISVYTNHGLVVGVMVLLMSLIIAYLSARYIFKLI